MVTTSAGSGRMLTSRGTRVPTAIEKLTLLTGATCSLRITVVILVRCSVESFAPAPAWPVVTCERSLWPSRDSALLLLVWPSRPSAFILLFWPSRPSALMPLAPPLVSFSELMPLDLAPGACSSARWPLVAPGDFCVSDCVDEAPVLSRPVVAPPPDGVVCCVAAPPDSFFIPPCALARPAPAISASAATEIIKRFFMQHLLSVLALPAPTTEG